MALQPTRVGDIVVEMLCKCGKSLLKLSMVEGWKCRECHQFGTKGYRWRIDAIGLTGLPSWGET